MKVTTIRTNWAESELKQNTHIITIKDKCIIVDAGASLQDVLDIVGDNKVEAILITHAHFDHISNVDAYEIAFGCPIYMNEHSKKFLHDPELNVSKYFVQDIVFDAENIRKTARGIGLITDDSQRYEKTLDPELTPQALARIVYLIKQHYYLN